MTVVSAPGSRGRRAGAGLRLSDPTRGVGTRSRPARCHTRDLADRRADDPGRDRRRHGPHPHAGATTVPSAPTAAATRSSPSWRSASPRHWSVDRVSCSGRGQPEIGKARLAEELSPGRVRRRRGRVGTGAGARWGPAVLAPAAAARRSRSRRPARGGPRALVDRRAGAAGAGPSRPRSSEARPDHHNAHLLREDSSVCTRLVTSTQGAPGERRQNGRARDRRSRWLHPRRPAL